MLLNPNAFSALAFEHMNEIAGVRIDHRPDEMKSSVAETATLVRLILDSSHLLSSKYIHGAPQPQANFSSR
jgi:hypothetical protein